MTGSKIANAKRFISKFINAVKEHPAEFYFDKAAKDMFEKANITMNIASIKDFPKAGIATRNRTILKMKSNIASYLKSDASSEIKNLLRTH